jgi:tRNA A-37 threonylcarbamoyl transferase component Bud32/HAMP domain-containing protein
MSDSAYPDALPTQYRLHWYLLERVLGQGGFGITYLARDTNLDQAVAIKEYLPVDVATRRADATVRPRSEDLSERYRWGLDRFIREARTLARFDHANIVRVHSVFEHNGTAYMVMRFEEGENFAALLERKRNLGEDELMRVLLPVLDGLALVHEAGFIHRDIKPDNIHIRADGSPVLLDFGSARHSLGHARTVTILVAPGYAPFEQYYSSGEDQGPWTDIYSLGATCYRAIAGAAPLDAIARSKGILGSTKELLVPAAAIGAGRYSASFLKAVDHALAFAEKDRPQSIAAWRAELVASGSPAVGSRPAPVAAVSAAAAAAPAAAGSTGSKLWLGLAVLAIAAAAAGTVAWLQQREQRLADLARQVEEMRAKDEKAREDARRRDEIEARRKQEEENRSKVAAAAEPPARTDEPVALPAPAPKAKPPAKTRPAPAAEAKPPAIEPSPPAPVPAPSAAPVQVPTEPRVQYEFFRKLALQGDADAALRVAQMLEEGRGVAQSNLWACGWYELAARRGVAAAAARKSAVALGLQPRELKQCNDWADGQRRAGG